jgi:beta-lactam-binding protein with PASTA domain
MDLKKFWKETFGGFILKNLLIAAGVVVILGWGVLICLDFYTHHGEAEIVPDLRGSYIEEAEILLKKQGLTVQVIDSVYVPNRKLGTIIEQIPVANSTLKRNRPVYVVINSRQVHQVVMPDLINLSYRQADAMLQSIGVNVRNVEYAPSEYKDLVIGVKYHERIIAAGTRVSEGSSVILIVGNGMGTVTGSVPTLKGMPLDDATQIVLKDSFVIGSMQYDVPPTSSNEKQYFIYRQHPAGGSQAPVGSRIDIYLTRDKARLNETFEDEKKPEEKEEQFF